MKDADAQKQKVYVPAALKLKTAGAMIDFVGGSPEGENKEKPSKTQKPTSTP